MSVLVLIDYQNDENQKIETSLNTLLSESIPAINAAQQLNVPVHALVVGHGASAIAKQVTSIKGVDKVLYLDDDYFQHANQPLLPERIAPLIATLAQETTAEETNSEDTYGYTHLCAAATGVGKNIMPRTAALLDVMQVSEITKIIDHSTFEHFIYAGSVIERVQSNQPKHVLTIRSTHFSSDYESQDRVESIDLAKNNTISDCVEKMKEKQQLSSCLAIDNNTTDGTPDLSMAKIIVAGGGGIKSQEAFTTLITPLAKKLGAAIAASRIPVANGFCTSDYLVGQTGKAVAPELYIAIGISGANQHISGMKESKTIIAINTDENAPIFRYADYGLVMDINEALPILTKT